MAVHQQPQKGGIAVSGEVQVPDTIDARQLVRQAEHDPRFRFNLIRMADDHIQYYLRRIHPWVLAGSFGLLILQGVGWIELPRSVLTSIVVMVLAPTSLLTGIGAVVLALKGKTAKS